MKLRTAVVSVIGAVVWAGAVLGRLSSVREELWIARDDAVITLSHARNAAQFGSIGVSPGGDRVEGFSSPTHFLLAYVAQLVAEPGYRSLAGAILVATLIVTGAMMALALRGLARQAGLEARPSELVALALTGAVAIAVAAPWTSVGWIGSGMENPVVVLCGVAVVAALVAGSTPYLVNFNKVSLTIALVLFMLTRVEFAAFSIPLVCASAWLVASRSAAGRQVRAFVQLVGAPLALVGFVHLGRKAYFGDWLPNTAVVQGRETGFDQFLLIGIVAAILLIALARAALLATTPDAKRRGQAVDMSIIGAVAVAGFILIMLVGRTGATVGDLLALPPVVPLAVLIALLLGIRRVMTSDPWLMNHVFASLSAIPITQFLALGPARLDQHRVAVMAIPFLAMWAAALSVNIIGLVRAPATDRTRWHPRVVPAASVLVAVVALAGVAISAGDGSRNLDFAVASAPELVAVVHEVRQEQLGGGLAILANPDLGKVSFDKSAVMIDLGLLGDPLLTRIAQQRPELVAPYLHFVGRPDVLEVHGFWSCQYTGWVDSPEFAAAYELSDPRWLDNPPQSDGCLLDGRYAVWVRTDADLEYALTRELLASADPAEVVRAATVACTAEPGNVFRCQAVRRSVQRAAVELQNADQFDQVIDAVRLSPSAAVDVPFLQRNAGWADDAFAGLVALVDGT